MHGIGSMEMFTAELVDLVQVPRDTWSDSLLASVGQMR